MIITKNRTKSLFALILAVVMATLFLSVPVSASASDSMGFVVHPNLPNNQTNPGLGYFDIMVKPGDVQTITLDVSNSSNEDLVVEVEAIAASTTPSGNINYTGSDTPDETLKYPFSGIASTPEENVTIPPNSTKNVSIEIKVPKEKFDGIVLGGVRIKNITARLELEKLESSATDGAIGSNVKFINEYEYVIGVVLRENNNKVEPNFELVKITPEIVNHRAGVVAAFRNTSTDVVKHANYSAEVLQRGTSNAIFSITDKEIDMAPNSVMKYQFVDEAGYGIVAGDYTLKAKIEYQDQVWNFEEEFTVEKEVAELVNTAALNQQQVKQAGVPVWVIVAIILGLILIALIIILIVKLTQNKK